MSPDRHIAIALSLALPALGGADWPGLEDRSEALQTDVFSFSGDTVEQWNTNENYYDGDFGDFDGDHQPDRALGARYGLLMNRGGGWMTPLAGYTGFVTHGMAGAAGWPDDAFQWLDADGDGDLDVISGGNEPLVMQRNARGRFTTAWSNSSEGVAGAMGLTDVEGDGDVDVLTAGFGSNFGLFINDGTGDYEEESAARGLPLSAQNVSGFVSGDLDGDRDYDLVLSVDDDGQFGSPKNFRVALNDGTGNYDLAVTPFATPFLGCCLVNSLDQGMNLGDVDDDGDLDFVVAFGVGADHLTDPEVNAAVFINDGAGNLVDDSAARLSGGDYDPADWGMSGKIGGGNAKIADIDYDGDLDLLMLAKNSGRVSILANDGQGHFTYDSTRSPEFPGSAVALGSDLDVIDLDSDGTSDLWVGLAGGNVRELFNLHVADDGLPADVPRQLVVDVDGGAVELSWQAPPFASVARSYRVYRAVASSTEHRDRVAIAWIGHRHQDESFADPITRHTTTDALGQDGVTLDGATNTIRFIDATAVPGVTYAYSVTHVGTENDESAPTAEVAAMLPGQGGDDDTSPIIELVSPTQQDWGAYPRIVAHYADENSGIDPSSVRITFDRALGDPGNGGYAAGEDVAALAYRMDAGGVILPVLPPLSFAAGQIVRVTVEVADNAGNVATAESEMFVQLAAPSLPTASFDTAVTAEQSRSFDASGSTDDDGKIIRWEWYFGDNTTAIGRVVEHTFPGGGEYDVTLAVTDNDGGVAVVTQTVMVDGAPPACLPGDSEDCYGGPEGTLDVGACRGGIALCEDGQWGTCSGEIVPLAETCDDGVDDDCNGVVDDCDGGSDGGDSTGDSVSGGDGSASETVGGADASDATGGSSGDAQGPGADEQDSGCACRSTEARISGAWWLVVVAVARRRARRP